MLYRTFTMTDDDVHMGVAMYIGRDQEQRKRRCLHEESDDMTQGIICITAASQTLLLICTCCFPFIAIAHSLFCYVPCFQVRLLHYNVCPSLIYILLCEAKFHHFCQQTVNSSYCSNQGDLVCGLCECVEGRLVLLHVV